MKFSSRAAESEGAVEGGLKQYIVEKILHFQKYSECKACRGFFNLCFLNWNCFYS